MSSQILLTHHIVSQTTEYNLTVDASKVTYRVSPIQYTVYLIEPISRGFSKPKFKMLLKGN